MSALNSNNTFDGLDEPVRPTPGVENADWTKKITKNNKKRRFSGGALIPTVGCQRTPVKVVFNQLTLKAVAFGVPC